MKTRVRFTMCRLFIAKVCMAAVLLLSGTARGETFARDGRSQFTIIVNHGGYRSAEDASRGSEEIDWFGTDAKAATACTESFAAIELRHYLCAITGLDPNDSSQFPIRGDGDEANGNLIVLGGTSSNARMAPFSAELDSIPGAARDAPEGFRLQTVRKDGRIVLLLSGNDRVGTLYSVYELLGRLGVRWFSPGVAGEVVPNTPRLDVPDLAVAEAPKFALRGYWAEFFGPENDFVRPTGRKGTIEFFDWMARNRMNLWSSGEKGVLPGEMKKRGLHLSAGGHTFYTLILPDEQYPYRVSESEASADRPLDPYAPSPLAKGRTRVAGAITYAAMHPEWYGLGPDAKRHFTTDPFGYNFCTSNADFQKEFLKNLITKLSSGDWKYADYLDWWPEDADHWCMCDECTAQGSPTDRNLIMAHLIREGLKKARLDGRLNRDIKVNFLIYSSAGVVDPPTKPLPAGFDYKGIMGTFFPIYRCYVHSLADPNCTEFNQRYARYLKAWRDSPFYKGRFMIGEYYNISYFRDLPILFTGSMENDVRYYYRSGARAMHYMHIPMGNWGSRTITNYQFARMLWDPDLDLGNLKADYFRKRYEEAGPEMAKFYKALEAALVNVPEYVATPGEDECLAGQIRAFADGTVTSVFPYRHLRLRGDHPEPDAGLSIEDSIVDLDLAQRFLLEALGRPIGERARACVLEDEALFRYGDAMVRFFFHMARSTEFPLRSPAWDAEIRAASIQAEYLDNHPVAHVAVYGGTKDMVRNALDSTGIKDVYLKWKAMLP